MPVAVGDRSEKVVAGGAALAEQPGRRSFFSVLVTQPPDAAEVLVHVPLQPLGSFLQIGGGRRLHSPAADLVRSARQAFGYVRSAIRRHRGVSQRTEWESRSSVSASAVPA